MTDRSERPSFLRIVLALFVAGLLVGIATVVAVLLMVPLLAASLFWILVLVVIVVVATLKVEQEMLQRFCDWRPGLMHLFWTGAVASIAQALVSSPIQQTPTQQTSSVHIHITIGGGLIELLVQAGLLYLTAQ